MSAQGVPSEGDELIQKLFYSGKKFKQGDWRWYLLAVYRPLGFLAARRVLRDMSQIDKQHKGQSAGPRLGTIRGRLEIRRRSRCRWTALVSSQVYPAAKAG